MTKTKEKQVLQALKEIIPEGNSIISCADKIGRYLDSLEVIPESATSWIKDQIQSEALDAWMEQGCWGFIAAATGVGKSKIGVDATCEITGYSSKILILVPTEKLRDENWKDEFEKWGQIDVWDTYVESECYASAHKIEGKEFDLVICDEWHNTTENNSVFFAQNKVHRTLWLSATTPKDETKRDIARQLGVKQVYNIPLDTAVQLRLVAPYEIVVVETSLDKVDKYVKAGSKDKPFFQTEAAAYDYRSKVVQNLMYSNDPKKKAASKFAVLNRMRFIYNLESKTKAARHILSLIPRSEKTIVFCGSIEQAEKLADIREFIDEGITVVTDRTASFHSKCDDTMLKLFQENSLDRLTCVAALNEGMNLNGVDCAVIVQLNSNELNLIQRIGRAIRYIPGHVAKIIIICCTDTQDEIWTKKSLAPLDSSKIRYVRYQNIVSGADTL